MKLHSNSAIMSVATAEQHTVEVLYVEGMGLEARPPISQTPSVYHVRCPAVDT